MIAKAYLIGFYVSCGFAVTKLSPVVHGKDPWFELVLDCETARQIPLVQVDAFTSEPFQGNPAAVALLSADQFHSKNAPKWMQRVALENNLSETAFVAPRESAGDSGVVEFDLKWFTPGMKCRGWSCGEREGYLMRVLPAPCARIQVPRWRFADTRPSRLRSCCSIPNACCPPRPSTTTRCMSAHPSRFTRRFESTKALTYCSASLGVQEWRARDRL